MLQMQKAGHYFNECKEDPPRQQQVKGTSLLINKEDSSAKDPLSQDQHNAED